jgi:hypothetical protein
MGAIAWHNDLQTALSEARAHGKNVLLQFKRDPCAGCSKMEALTYQDAQVQAEMERWFTPLHLDIIQNRQERRAYSAVWTPSFYFLDARGNVTYAFNGYQNVEDFRVLMRLGKAALDLPRGRYLDTVILMEESLDLFPNHPRAASFLFTSGMAQYLLGKDKSAFRSAMTDIIRLYPHSPEARMWPWMDEPPG